MGAGGGAGGLGDKTPTEGNAVRKCGFCRENREVCPAGASGGGPQHCLTGVCADFESADLV